MKNKRCVIVGGAAIGNYDALKARLSDDDFVIYCDSGLNHLDGLGRKPDLIVGDFDTHENPHLDAETIVLPVAKDDTDLGYAAKAALERGYRDFLLVGVLGGRTDLTMGTIAVMLMLDSAGAKAVAADDRSDVEVVSGRAEVGGSFEIFSLINIDNAHGITIRNAKFPLESGEIGTEGTLGISNEPLPGQTAEIEAKTGRLLIVKVYSKTQNI